MADTRDPNRPSENEVPGSNKPQETDLSEEFMTREEVEPHKLDGTIDTINGIKMGHAKVPTFLKFTYAALAAWGLFYMVTASPLNDRTEAAPSAAPTVDQGADIFSTSCAGCHNPTEVRKVGPGLKGVSARLGEEELLNVLHNGRPQKGMPAPPSLGLKENDIQSIKLYLESLK
ncbi:MAG TPA: cytochrome c [Bacilli bacterium]|nr:cytochrome c [Bacilli bacterium]